MWKNNIFDLKSYNMHVVSIRDQMLQSQQVYQSAGKDVQQNFETAYLHDMQRISTTCYRPQRQMPRNHN